ATAYPAGTQRGHSHEVALVRKAVESLFLTIVASHPTRIPRLQGIAMSGHGPSVLLAGIDGTALSDLFTWQDSDARSEEEAIRESFAGFDKGGSSYEGKAIRLFRRHPDLFTPGVKILYPKDYFSSLLTGRMSTDRSTASTIIFWDDQQMVWNPGATGIPSGFFPEVIEPWGESGRTGTVWSRSCGLPDGVPVYGGGIDAYSELLGVGAVSPGALVDGTGTSTCLSIILPETGNARAERQQDQPGHKPSLPARTDRHLLPGLRLRMETMSYTGGSLQWFLRLLGSSLAEAMATMKPGPVALLFLPYLLGERSPVWDAKASGVFAGLRSDTGRPELLAAIMQGCAFGVRQNLEVLGSLGTVEGRVARDIMAVGGGAGNDAWLQMKADITGSRYLRPVYPEAAPLGAAMLAVFGREGIDPAELAARFVRTEKTFEPVKAGKLRDSYNSLYGLYTDMYTRLRDTLLSLAELRDSADPRINV
ncbi:MAG: FGGY-family carbohydrate kinase, partial [Spirochaetota bacterium]